MNRISLKLASFAAAGTLAASMVVPLAAYAATVVVPAHGNPATGGNPSVVCRYLPDKGWKGNRHDDNWNWSHSNWQTSRHAHYHLVCRPL